MSHDSTSTNYTYDAGNRITQVQEMMRETASVC